MHTNCLNLFIVGGLVGVTTICGVVLASTNYKSYATSSSASASANASVTVGAACTLNATTNPPHITTVANGTSSPDSGFGLTTFKATCNDPGGLSIYAVGWTNDTYGTTTMVGSANSSNVINTGTSGSNSWWAMKLGTSGSSYVASIQNSFNNWHAIPSAWTEVARYTSATDIGDSAVGSTITVTYKASISTTQAADTYIGKVKYILTNPYSTAPSAPVACSSMKICYNANGSNVVGTMGQQGATSNASIELLASNFSREGYGFAGWNDKFDYSGNFYGPQEGIITPASMSNGLSLYAVWVKSEGYLQDAATVSSVCGRLTQSGPNVPKTLSSVSALTDKRDGQTYAIAKLADGNCWMIENLRLEAEYSADESLAQGFGKFTTYGNFSGLATAESANFNSTDPPVANTKYSIDGSNGTTSIDSGRSAYARMPRYNNTCTQNRATNPTDGVNNIYSYGNYYTWSAAMANTYGYSSYLDTDPNGKTSDTVNTSICPSGWRLPYGRTTGNGATSGGFSYLDIQLGGTGMTADPSTTPTGGDMNKIYATYPNNFIGSGIANNSSLSSRGSNGWYWSSTSSNQTKGYYLHFYGSYLYPGTYDSSHKYHGASVRCVMISV